MDDGERGARSTVDALVAGQRRTTTSGEHPIPRPISLQRHGNRLKRGTPSFVGKEATHGASFDANHPLFLSGKFEKRRPVPT
jgi:hypothetical protein